jgi:hypothetical protein
VTELIVRELRLRGFDGVTAISSSRFEAAEHMSDAAHRPSDEHLVERLADRHSRRRPRHDELGL